MGSDSRRVSQLPKFTDLLAEGAGTKRGEGCKGPSPQDSYLLRAPRQRARGHGEGVQRSHVCSGSPHHEGGRGNKELSDSHGRSGRDQTQWETRRDTCAIPVLRRASSPWAPGQENRRYSRPWRMQVSGGHSIRIAACHFFPSHGVQSYPQGDSKPLPA